MKRARFDQLCGVATALDVVGDRWALLVVRELFFSPKRFSDLLPGLPGIGSNTLAVRLKEMEEAGLIQSRLLPPPLPVAVYELTALGRSLEPVLLSLGRWGGPLLLTRRPKHRLRAPWLGWALKIYYRAEAAPKKRTRIALDLAGGALTLELGGGAPLRIVEGIEAVPQLTLHASAETILLLVRGVLTRARALREKSLRVEGDAALLPVFLECFPLGGPA